MDRQEAIQTLSKIGKISVSYAEDLYDSFFPNPVIPWYIADYLEKVKSEGDYNVVGAVNEAPEGEVSDWLILENVNTFAKAWVNGYEVEKEKRYRVSMPKTRNRKDHAQLLCEANGKVFWCGEWYRLRTKFTRKELEDADFGWVFSCPGVEVKEVTDE